MADWPRGADPAADRRLTTLIGETFDRGTAGWPLPSSTARALLDGELPARDPSSRRALAVAALTAARDGSIAVDGTRRLALRALAGEPPDLPTLIAAGTALCYCDSFAELDAAVGAMSADPELRALLGIAELRRGRLRIARAHLESALTGAGGPDVEAALSECALELGEPDPHPGAEDVDAVLSRGRRTVAQGRSNPACSAWRSEAAALYLRRGDASSALALASAELTLARLFGAPRAIGIALRATGMALSDEPARRQLGESIAVLSGSGAELELARAQVELGAHLRRSGERREGRDSLRAGLDLAERLGATALAGRAEVELRATGARPRRAVLSGLDALTASELRVAELAAAGLTNRAIGQELFVTMRTVTTHLTHIYQKLDIGGRDEIAPLLAQRDQQTAPRQPVAPATAADRDRDTRLPAITETLRDLTAPAAALAQALAILVDVEPASPEHVAISRSLADLDPAAAEAARRELSMAGLLDTGLGHMPPPIGRQVYDALTVAQRADGHAAAARLLGVQPRALRATAGHLARTPPAGKPDTVALLRDAAATAMTDGAPHEACELLRRAIAEVPIGDDPAPITAELGTAEAVLRHPAAELHLLAAAGEPAADTLRCIVQLVGGRPSDAHGLASATAASLGAEVAPELLAPLETAQACVALLDRRYADELPLRIPVIRTLSVAAGPDGRPLELVDAFWKWTTSGTADGSLRQIDRLLAERSLAPPAPAGDLAAGLALVPLVAVDDRARAERAIESATSDAGRRGSVASALLALAWSSHLALRTGDVGGALRDAATARELAGDRDVGAIAPLLAAFQAEALIERGDLVAAVDALRSVSLEGREATVLAAYVSFARGRVLLASGERAEAIAELRRCRTSSIGLFVDNPNVLPSRSWLARAIGTDELDEARSLAADELALARRLRQPRAIGTALHTLALLDREPDHFGAAIATLRRAPAPLLQAYALSDLGDELRARALDSEADAARTEALTLAVSSGATALAEALAGRLRLPD